MIYICLGIWWINERSPNRSARPPFLRPFYSFPWFLQEEEDVEEEEEKEEEDEEEKEEEKEEDAETRVSQDRECKGVSQQRGSSLFSTHIFCHLRNMIFTFSISSEFDTNQKIYQSPPEKG